MVLHLIVGCIHSGKSQRLLLEHRRQMVLNAKASLLSSKAADAIPDASSVVLLDDYDGTSPPVAQLLEWADQEGHAAFVAFDVSLVKPDDRKMLQLFAHAESVEVLTSFCSFCSDGTPAHFTVGEGKPACRRHAFPGKGQLDLVIGPMFAGKSSELIRLVRKYRLIGKRLLVLKPNIDVRYDAASVCTHAGDKEGCVCVKALGDALTMPEYVASDVVFVEEAQFFPDVLAVVKTMVFEHGKHVYVMGLNGDFNREVFGDLLCLAPYADGIKLLSSLCKMCKDGTDAVFSKRIVASKEQVLVGTEDAYAPVCRRHYRHS